MIDVNAFKRAVDDFYVILPPHFRTREVVVNSVGFKAHPTPPAQLSIARKLGPVRLVIEPKECGMRPSNELAFAVVRPRTRSTFFLTSLTVRLTQPSTT